MPLGVHALEDPDVLYSGNCIVYNIENDTVCYADGEDDRVAPAGTVKIMTASIAIEYYHGKYDTPITIQSEWLEDVTGLTAKFRAGETVTADDAIAALILGSGNDAAYILANAIGGSTGDFVKMMNDRAKELGMKDTVYLNPTGTEQDGTYTTVKDVLTVTKHAYSLPKYIELSDSPSVSLDATNMSNIRTIYNRNYFVSNYYNLNYLERSVMGLNAGMSESAGWCLSTIGRSDTGLTYIVVVMGARDPAPVEDEEDGEDKAENTEEKKKEETEDKYFVSGYEDARTLLNWAYDNFGYFTLLDTSTMVCEVPVKLSGKLDHVILLPEEKLVSFLPLDTDVDSVVTKEWTLVSDTLKAPLSQGQVVGKLKVTLEGEDLGEVNLIARNNVDRSNWLLLIDTVITFLTRPLVLIIIILFLTLSFVYAVFAARRLARKRQIVKYKTNVSPRNRTSNINRHR